MFGSTVKYIFILVAILVLSTRSQAQTNVVPDDIEFAVLKNIYDSLGGSGWTNKTNWPSSGSWPASATSAQFGTWQGVTVANGDITRLTLSGNNLTGLLPKTIGNLKKLTFAYLQSNSITGSIPASFGGLTSIQYLYLHQNQLTGSIPSELGNLTTLSRLLLNNNNLSGSIPSSLGNITSLSQLYLNYNQLTGNVPSTLGNLANLVYLYLRNNQLTGALPSTFGSLVNLQHLSVSNNQLSGSLPSTLSNLTELLFVDISNNQFTGSLPSVISWVKVNQLLIGRNQLSGPFPATISSLPLLTILQAEYNAFTSLPASLLNLPTITTIGFSENELIYIPDFSSHVNKANLTLQLQKNRLDFSQLEILAGKGIKTFTYNPQKLLNDITYKRAAPGGTLLLPARNPGQNGSLVWERKLEGNSSWITVTAQNEDATQRTFKKSNITMADDGLFRYRMTNSVFSGFAIESSPITVRVGLEVVWNGLTGVTESQGILSKTAAIGWGNGNGNSENSLAANTDGWFEFVVDENSVTSNYVLGFSTADSDLTRAGIAYGLEINSQSGQKVYIHESNETGVELGTWSIGDVFKVQRDGSTIRYYKNSTEIRSITVNPAAAYQIKGIVYSGKAPLTTASFWIPAARGFIPDAWEYEALKDLYDTTGGGGWSKKTGWPAAGNWVKNITATQLDTWLGIVVVEGDVTGIALTSNNLTGKLPGSISKLSKLNTLDLRSNKITGKIPSSLTTLTSLKDLRLYDNKFTGPIPEDIGNLINLEYLTFGRNSLSGPIPPSIGNLTKLYYLSLYINAGLSGSLPDSFYNLVNLTDLYLYETGISGTLSEQIGNLTKLKTFWGYSNKWSGPLPSSLGDLTSLENLYIYGNEFTGSLPSNWSKLTNLKNFWIHYTKISGEIPSWIWNFTKMEKLSIGDNNMTGTIPSDISNLVNMTELYMQRLGLRGGIPDEMQALNKLTVVDFKYSNLEGAVPEWLMKKPTIKTYALNNNNFTSLPDFSSRTDKASLTINLENNQIPSEHIERYFTAANVHPFNVFSYGPQKNTKLISAVRAPLFNVLKVEAPSGGLHGVYVWEKLVNDAWTNVNQLDENSLSNIFQINSVSTYWQGAFRYTVTNTWMPAIKFESGIIEINTVNEALETLDLLAFQYRYDHKKRLVKKKLPGADWVHMVYDDRDRLVLTQDGNQRNKAVKEWTFIKYDVLNRPVITGLFKDNLNRSHAQMQDDVNDYYSYAATGRAWYESYNGANALHGYDNKSFPIINDASDCFTITYYDDYECKTLMNSSVGVFDYDKNQIPSLADQPGQEEKEFDRVNDQVTATKVKSLDSDQWLWKIFYYDDEYREIQIIAQNHKGGIDKTTNVYDFTGRRTSTKINHELPQKLAVNLVNTYDYDHVGRLKRITNKVNDLPSTVVAENDYNELGYLITKKLHSRNSTSFKQEIDYGYSIRGWLLNINKADLTMSRPNEPQDFFGMEFAYNEDFNSGSKRQFNGNIAAIKWSGVDGKQSIYNHYYDGLNRLTTSHYRASIDGQTWESNVDQFNALTEFDLNGNIVSMKRHSGQGTLVDNLKYHYSGNQLKYVDDFGRANSGFLEGNKYNDDYEYDTNGNLIKDLNKGLVNIKYNYFNLPISFLDQNNQNIRYQYDANGVKLSQLSYDENEQLKESTEFIGPFLYVNDTLQSVSHQEGQIIVSNDWEYQYNLLDHVGNTRLVFSTKEDVDIYTASFEDSSIEEENKTFKNYTRTNNDLFDHTDPGNTSKYSQKLFGGQSSVVGLAKSLAVLPGDKINVTVFGKYFNPTTSSNSGLVDVASSLINALSLTTTGPGDPASAIRDFFAEGPVILGTGLYPWDDETAPKAYINAIIFNDKYEIVDFAYDQININAEQPVGELNKYDHDEMSLELEIKQQGYVYIYLSNENSEMLEVYFDDLNLQHRHSDVIQRDDFYPFELSIPELSYQKRNTFYKGSSYSSFFGYKDLGFRRYDPSTGRFSNIDPLSELQSSESPYQYAKNNPIRFVDKLGLSAIDGKDEFNDIEGNRNRPVIPRLKRLIEIIKGKIRLFFASLHGRPQGSIKAGNIGHDQRAGKTRRSLPPAPMAKGDRPSNYIESILPGEFLNGVANDDGASSSSNDQGPTSKDFDDIGKLNKPSEKEDAGGSDGVTQDKYESNNSLVEDLNGLVKDDKGKSNVEAQVVKQGGPVLAEQLQQLHSEPEKKPEEKMKPIEHNTSSDLIKKLIDNLKESFAEEAQSSNITENIKDLAAGKNEKYARRYTAKVLLDEVEIDIEVTIEYFNKNWDVNNQSFNVEIDIKNILEFPEWHSAFGRNGNYVRYSFNDKVNEKNTIAITLPVEKSYDFEKYAGIIEGGTDKLVADILPSDAPEEERVKYQGVLDKARSTSGANSNMTPDKFQTDQIWKYDGTWYNRKKEVLNSAGKPVSVTKVGDKKECWEATADMVVNAGHTSGNSARVYQVAMEDAKTRSKLVYNQEQMKKGIKSILDHLDAQRPIQVGVNYFFGSDIKDGKERGNVGNKNKSTDHFILITGMKYDEEGKPYFEFYDPGTSDTENGTTNNRLYIIEKDGGYILKGTGRGVEYEVTEIRPNGDFDAEGTTDLSNKKTGPCETIVCY